MKEQTIDHNKFEEFDSVKYRKRLYADEEYEKLSGAQKRRFISESNQNLCGINGRLFFEKSRMCNGNGDGGDQDDEALIRETQAALKSLSGSWSETNAPVHRKTAETDECTAFPNLFDEKSNVRKMQMVDSLATEMFHSTKTTPSMYAIESKSKSSQMKDVKYESYDFDELACNNDVDDVNKETKFDNKKSSSLNGAASQTNQMTTLFSPQNSAFRPPSFDNKKNPFIPTMPPYSTYHYNADANSGYSSYPMEVNSSMTNLAEREFAFQKAAGKEEDEPNPLCDSKQYTTLQPAGVGSKAASVMQEIVREGVISVSAVSNSNNHNNSSTASNVRISADRPIAVFSPGSSNKGKYFSHCKDILNLYVF